MPKLPLSLREWGSEGFADTLKKELQTLDSGTLPLARCGNRGGPIDDSELSISLLTQKETDQALRIKLGIFFYEVSAGGACGDDTLYENTYGVILASIDKASAETTFEVLPE